MADKDVIKEFLVGLGWKVDEQGYRRATDAIEGVATRLSLMAAGAVAAGIAITKAIENSAEAFEKLYYSSQRTGSSVNNLRALEFAASKFGSSVEEASAAVESLSKKFRDSPGYAAQLRSLGVDMSGDNVHRLESFMDRLAKMQTPQRNAYLNAYGFSEQLFYALENPQFRKAYDDYLKRQKQAGLDADKAAFGATKFMQSLRDLRSTISNIWDSAASAIFERYGDVFKKFGDYLNAHGAEIKDFLLRIAHAILKIAEEIGGALPKIDKMIEGTIGWENALKLLMATVALSVLPGLARLATLLTSLIAFRLPVWLLGLLGLSGGVAGAAVVGGLAAGAGAYAAGGDDPSDAGDGSLWGRVKGVGRRIGRGIKNALGVGSDDGAGGRPGAVSGSMSERGMALMKRLIEVHGWTPEAAAIAAGNAQQESSITPNGPLGDSGTAHGMFQWRNERAAAMHAYVAAHPELSAFDAQVDFFNQERLHGGAGHGSTGLERGWHAEHDLSHAAALGRAFEGYGDNSTGTRVANAREWLRRWQSRNIQARATLPSGFHAGIEGAKSFGSTPPIGGSPTTHNAWNKTSNTTNTQNVQIHVDGSASPTDTAHAIAGNLKRSGSDLVRNMTPQAQ